MQPFYKMMHVKSTFDFWVRAHQNCSQRHPITHTYLSTHATNCYRLGHEGVKGRSPCLWPQLISCSVVFYVMPHSPRILCSLQRQINTPNHSHYGINGHVFVWESSRVPCRIYMCPGCTLFCVYEHFA